MPLPGLPSPEKVFIGNVLFIKRTWTDLAAGNIYAYTTFETKHYDACIVVTFVLRSGSPEMFDPPRMAFNAKEESAVFDGIMTSVKFE